MDKWNMEPDTEREVLDIELDRKMRAAIKACDLLASFCGANNMTFVCCVGKQEDETDTTASYTTATRVAGKDNDTIPFMLEKIKETWEDFWVEQEEIK